MQKPVFSMATVLSRHSSGRRRVVSRLTAAMSTVLLVAHEARSAEEATIPAQPESPQLEISIDTPEEGATVGGSDGLVFLAGRVIHRGAPPLDVMFVIDTSESTKQASGADVDGDGNLGKSRRGWWSGRNVPLPSTDEDDSLLAAEVVAVRALLGQLDPATTRAGLVSFSGDNDALTPDSETVVPLTSDFDEFERGLTSVLRHGSHGLTNMLSAVSLAAIELLGTKSAYSTKREGARRMILFLTDGQPTLPLENSPMQNARMTIQQAMRAHKLDVRIDTFAIGEDALQQPVVMVEMARVTGGVYTPLRDLRNLPRLVAERQDSDIARFTVCNRTTGEGADQVDANVRGNFTALLAVVPGRNEVELFARSAGWSRR